MAGKRKKKYETGEGAAYMSRKAALKRLQLTLKDFRKLCILKGVYPREPSNRKKAQKGATGIKTLYSKKDILFLAAEPMIWKMREQKSYFKRLGRAKALNNKGDFKRLLENFPTLTLDHIVKERYPSFIDALRDLDDCLTLLFLFSTFPSLKTVPREQSNLCRRLTIEFMHAVISARALRKVFVSIKGFYYQAEIRGETITWIVPHYFSFQPQSKGEVNFKVMSQFVEFYTVMLGFVNYRLYNYLNLYYPPKLTDTSGEDWERTLVDEEAFAAERIASLNIPLVKSSTSGSTVEEEENQTLDEFPMTDDPKRSEELRKAAERANRLKTLFKGLKIFVNREVSREPIVFCVRSFGGQVSWDKTLFVGATFEETDETITHQIVDRPRLEKQYISRYYVQPQWVFDSVNAAELLPVERYFMGVSLPPHLSPFANDMFDQKYKPPEELLLRKEKGEPSAPSTAQESEDDDDDDDEGDDDKEEVESDSEDDEGEEKSSGNEEDDENDESNVDAAEKARLEKKKKMAVSKGAVAVEDPNETKRQDYAEFKLREKMIKNKHRRLYKSMMKGRHERNRDAWLLRKKRRNIDEQAAQERKEAKKKKKKEAAALQA